MFGSVQVLYKHVMGLIVKKARVSVCFSFRVYVSAQIIGIRGGITIKKRKKFPHGGDNFGILWGGVQTFKKSLDFEFLLEPIKKT